MPDRRAQIGAVLLFSFFVAVAGCRSGLAAKDRAAGVSQRHRLTQDDRRRLSQCAEQLAGLARADTFLPPPKEVIRRMDLVLAEPASEEEEQAYRARDWIPGWDYAEVHALKFHWTHRGFDLRGEALGADGIAELMTRLEHFYEVELVIAEETDDNDVSFHLILRSRGERPRRASADARAESLLKKARVQGSQAVLEQHCSFTSRRVPKFDAPQGFEDVEWEPISPMNTPLYRVYAWSALLQVHVPTARVDGTLGRFLEEVEDYDGLELAPGPTGLRVTLQILVPRRD